MAVTHDDLTVRQRSDDDGAAAGARGLSLIVFCVLCGLLSFILSLAAEATRSEETRCLYTGSGKTPLACGVAAFMALAVGMFTAQVYILIAASPRSSPIPRQLTRQACFFFLATWLSFAVAEVALMVGVSAESAHLGEWRKPRRSCLVVRQGLFAAAGVFALMTVFLAAGLYLTALQAQRMGPRDEEEHDTRRRVPLATAPRFPSQGGGAGIFPSDPQTHRPSGELPGSKTSPSS
ncbi:unnamed protein product [Spirodela intermedia]|uniref:Uncharacterized protein n=1 Tax=Spirodela intermedia TaxID=51605 RepID=A0A7I8IVF5_SPIIN|nr:unnamed protein product [Spirodela intermedia]CAA6661985.1 unnamed protein product [Spirodela intermedia]